MTIERVTLETEGQPPELEEVIFSFDSNGGWMEAVRQLCIHLSDPSRGDEAYYIPVEWLLDTIRSNWLKEGLFISLKEMLDGLPS